MYKVSNTLLFVSAVSKFPARQGRTAEEGFGMHVSK